MTLEKRENSIVTLYKSKKTVFSIKDLVLIWRINNPDYLKTKVNRLIKSGQLYFIRKGFYALDENYSKAELANKMVTPSYVGLYSVLNWEGTNFQYDSRIYSASDQSRTIYVGDQGYAYRKIKKQAFLNPVGLQFTGDKTIATKERAIVDMLYLEPDFYFDKLINVDWRLCFQIAKMYENKRLDQALMNAKEAHAG